MGQNEKVPRPASGLIEREIGLADQLVFQSPIIRRASLLSEKYVFHHGRWTSSRARTAFAVANLTHAVGAREDTNYFTLIIADDHHMTTCFGEDLGEKRSSESTETVI